MVELKLHSFGGEKNEDEIIFKLRFAMHFSLKRSRMHNLDKIVVKIYQYDYKIVVV